MITFSRKIGVALLLLASSSLALQAQDDLFSFNDKGALDVDGISIRLIHFGPGWKSTYQGKKLTVMSDENKNGVRTINGVWKTVKGDFDLQEVIKQIGSGDVSVSYALSNDTGVATQQAALTILLPASKYAGKSIMIDNEEKRLPTAFKKLYIPAPSAATQIALPCGKGWLNLTFDKKKLLLQDLRQYGRDLIEIRILIAGAGLAYKADLNVAMTYSDAPATPTPAQSSSEPESFIMSANDNWRPFTHKIDVEPGSILDFSKNVESPAGKYGPIIVSADGHFTFTDAPDKRIRMLGTNLCFSANFLSNEEADRLAERFRRMGYNTVRLHHYDGMLTRDQGDASGIALDPEKLDRLDYMFAAMKKAGLYVTIDFYTFREFPAGLIPEWDGSVRTKIKALVPLLPSAFNAWSGMVENLLNHVNPYTGIAWKDDPAFYAVCPMNEDTINHVSQYSGQQVKDLYQKAFEEYLKEKGETEKEGKERTRQFYAFIQDVKMRSNLQLEALIKGISPHLLVTGSNFIADRHQVFFRGQFDFVDNHQYWDHPSYPVNSWRLPNAYKQESATRNDAKLPRHMMPSRIFGSPFTVTEFNYCPPNKYRAEGGTLMGSYSALQDWDGLYRFAWAHSDGKATEVNAISEFDMATDPLSMMSERQIALFYARGDVAPAPSQVIYPVDMEEVLTNWWVFPEEFSKLGLTVQIGSWAFEGDEGLPKTYTAATGIRRPEGDLGQTPWMSFEEAQTSFGANSRTITSETEEIELNTDTAEIKLVTELSESLVIQQDHEATGKALSGYDPTVFTCISASSMDSHPLPKSQRVLLMHLTDVRNTQMTFQDDQLKLLQSWGKLPHLILRGTIDVTLKSGVEGMTLYAIDMSGKRMDVVPADYDDGVYYFTLDTAPDDADPRMAYELVKEESSTR